MIREKKNMKIHEKYLEALKTFDGFVTVSEWAIKVAEIYPDILKKAQKNVQNHKTPTSALQQVTRQISSEITRGTYTEYIITPPINNLNYVIILDGKNRRKKIITKRVV